MNFFSGIIDFFPGVVRSVAVDYASQLNFSRMSDKRLAESGSFGRSPVPPKRTKTDQKAGLQYSGIFRTNVTPSCTEYNQTSLETEVKAAMPWNRLHGLESIKRGLKECVELPLSNSSFFDLAPAFFGRTGAPGRIPVERVLFIYGPYGMGRSRLVYNLCKVKGLTLFDVQPIRFDPQEHIQTIYEKAVQEAPSIVMFDDCDYYFRDHPGNVGMLNYYMNKMAENKLPVWTVFLSHVRGDVMHQDIRPASECQFFAEPLNPSERSRFFDRALAERLDSEEKLDALNGDYSTVLSVFDDEVLDRCRSACHNYTPLQIDNWINRVFKKSLLKKSPLLRNYESSDPIFRPSSEDFANALVAVSGSTDVRLTDTDPSLTNVNPYRSAKEEKNARLNSAMRPPPLAQIPYGYSEESWQ